MANATDETSMTEGALQDDGRDRDRGLCAPDIGDAVAAALPDAAITEPADDDLARCEGLLLAGHYADLLDHGRALGERAPGALYLPLIRRLNQHWKADSVGIAELSFAYFQLQRLIRLASEPPVAAPVQGRVMIALAAGERHSFGAQILAAELGWHGWTVDLDLSGDGAVIRRQVAMRPYDAIGLSVGHDPALDGLADLITDLRHASCNPGMAVMLGGGALSEPHAQYAFLGADTIAASPAAATLWLASVVTARQPLHRT